MKDTAQKRILKERLQKLTALQKTGIDAYPSRVKRTHTNQEFLKDFSKLLGTDNKVSVVGRVKALRRLGKVSFGILEDGSGAVQVLLKKDALKDKYELIKNIEVGDFISVTGTAMETKTKEETVAAESFEVLTKALRPLPDKFHGLKDLEARYRRRELDLVMNETTRDIFLKRGLFIRYLRDFLDQQGFLEVETPILQPLPGGAEATPFVTHHETLDVDLYLRIASELYLKRLIVGGFEKVYEIGKDFRNEGVSPQHLQEFTMLEYYLAYADYEDLIEMSEKMIVGVLKKTFKTLKFTYEKHEIDFSLPWQRIDFFEAIKKETGIDLHNTDSKEKLLKEIKARKIKAHVEEGMGLGRLMDNLYKIAVRPKLIQPTILTGHPLEISPLAKKNQDRPGTVERFQIVVAGYEIANAYSELNDPRDQKERFEKAAKLRDEGDQEAHVMDADFVEALEYGMPPTAGFGLGIDRVMAIATNSSNVREVVFFPTLRPKK